MPFGRYRGRPIEGLPTAYLQALIGASDFVFALRAAVEDELRRRSIEELDGESLQLEPPWERGS
jgi:hypothetical protein